MSVTQPLPSLISSSPSPKKCETSGQTSSSTVFLQCSVCKVSCCRNCCNATAGYQLGSHTLEEVFATRDTSAFELRLRTVLPSTLVFPKASLEKMPSDRGLHANHAIQHLGNLPFTLRRVKRDRRCWVAHYFLREGGVGESLGEFSLRLGEVTTHHGGQGAVEVGVLGEFISFLPARVAPLVYGELSPVFVYKCLDPQGKGTWSMRMADKKGAICAEGSEVGLSFRAELGLTQKAADGCREGALQRGNVKHFNDAKMRHEERRWVYPSNWKQWPNVIAVRATEGDGSTIISGRYVRAGCRLTVNQNALWVREGASPLYLLVKPEVSRIGPDRVIISRSVSHSDRGDILACFPMFWDPCDALADPNKKVEISLMQWKEAAFMEVVVPASTMSIVPAAHQQETSGGTLLSVTGLSQYDVQQLTCRMPVAQAQDNVVSLPMATGQRAQQTVRAFNGLCAPQILRYAAVHGLPKPYNLAPSADWRTLLPPQVSPYGSCELTFPRPPSEIWVRDPETGRWDRKYEGGQSRAFYSALEARPRAFEFLLNKSKGSLDLVLHPAVVAHHAAGHLCRDRGGDFLRQVKVSIRLSDTQLQTDPTLEAFRVPSCHEEQPTMVGLREPYSLYERQQKVVSKMLAIERGDTRFVELEMYEEAMPGAIPWSLIAKAERERPICGGVIADAIGAGKTVISIAIMLHGLKEARKSAALPRKSGATLVVVPPGLIDQWKSEIEKFTTGMNVVCIYDLSTLEGTTVEKIVFADCVICPIDILQNEHYLKHMLAKADKEKDYMVEAGTSSSKKKTELDVPALPQYSGQKEVSGAAGTWIPASSQDPYGGANNGLNQRRRNESARYTHVYLDAVHSIRTRSASKSDKGLPLEYFEWERVFVDEIHESLCTTKGEIDRSNEGRADVFKEKNRRAGRELLGILTKDPALRPLVYRRSIFGLTGTPLLDSPSRVIELASLIGSTYIIGLSSHWRKLERESSRDIFLHYFLEPKQSREVRRNLYAKCQDYIRTACCRNKVGDEMAGVQLTEQRKVVHMSKEDGELYLGGQSGMKDRHFGVKVEDFDVSAGHNITKFLRSNVSLACRKQALRELCSEILDKDPTTKIIVFTDGRIGAGIEAREALDGKCTWLDEADTVAEKNKKISWYQYGDATDVDKARPRVLLLHFEHAAGLNLQTQCYNLILFAPLYVGDGGATSDAVSDTSTELQAIGRVFRPGQTKPVVNVFRIEVRGPNDEECLDGQLIRRNTDEETKSKAVNAED